MDEGRVVEDLDKLASGDDASKARLLALASEPASAALVLSLVLSRLRGKKRNAAAREVEARCRERLGLPSKLSLTHRTDFDELVDELVDAEDFVAAEAVHRYQALLNPDDARHQFNLASLLEYGVKDHQRALTALESAVVQFPNDADINHLLGLVLALRYARFAEALPYLQRSAELDPMESSYRSNVAWASGSVGDDAALYDNAVRALAQAGDRATDDDGWARAEATFCLYLLGPAREREERFDALIANLACGDKVFDWTFAPQVERAKQAKHPDAENLELLARVITSEAKPKALEAWPAARDAFVAAKRKPPKRKKVREAEDPYFIDLTSPPQGHTVPLLLHRFGAWLREYEDGSLGSFDALEAEAIEGWDTLPEPDRVAREAFSFLRLPEGSSLVLVGRGEGEPPAVGLLGSEGEHRTVATSLEAFLLSWSKSETNVSELDRDDDDDVEDARPALRRWLESNAITAPVAPDFDLVAWLGVEAGGGGSAETAGQALATPTGTRYFEKREGKKVSNWQLEQAGVRYSLAWSVGGGQSVGQTMTRDSEQDSARKVASKIREKLAEGFVEIIPAHAHAAAEKPAPVLGRVLDAYAKHAEKFTRPVRLLPGLERSYQVFDSLGFTEYLLLGPTETTGLWFAVKEGTFEPQQATCFLAFLEAQHDEVFGVSIAWKTRLPEAIGPFDHALILAPEVAQLHQEGLARRQLFQAFPIYDCEFRGDETISEAEARTDGRGCIPCANWQRSPHPVLDMRMQSSKAKKQSKRLIYDPTKNEAKKALRGLESLPQDSFLEVTNYRGSVARVVRTKSLELKLGDHAPESLDVAEIVARLEAFIRT